ncbi:tensin-4 isoform X1 [Ochotona princeps]|uniref:tensin-4 isoform X1 n=1 Tax=Ochotona princeps TaxID=9978 RepID=UPI0027149050|nr:tensin-4 isoform X1 [Ochotona princeps]
MSSPLLAGSPAVGLAACEEPRKPGAPSPGLPPQCPYYTTEGWGAPALMAPRPGQRSFTRLQQAPQAAARAHFNQPGPEEQASDPEELDSHIDFCLESLNQMILELDPTFQLLPPGPGVTQAEPAQRTTSRIKKEEPEALDIKYIEVTSTRPWCHDGAQRGSSTAVPTPFGSPSAGGLLLSRDLPRETRSSSESLIFSGSQGRNHLRPPLPSGSLSAQPPPSPSISIPRTESKTSVSHSSGSQLTASPGLEKGLWTPAPQQGSRSSALSTSPAPDVGSVFGSSQSLLRSSISSQQSFSPSWESPASSSSSLRSLSPISLCPRSSDSQVPSNPFVNTGQPGATSSPVPGKEHSSSCPSSATNSVADIPIVLINGCPEPGSSPPQQIPGHRGFAQPGATPPSQATKSHSQTLPDVPSIMSPEGLTRCTQPTMKFVMDTSKYWFKPSITREQAIELLRRAEPGAFIIRDSSSYRGSFGLALRVQEVPASAQNPSGEDGSDLIRHFLIESSAKGVHLKGADEEPYFGSLSAFVCQHSIMALALPCKLTIPQKELGGTKGGLNPSTDSPDSCQKKSAGCHTLYLSSVSVETLSGALAVQKAISTTLERDVLPTPTVVHFKVTEQGITLTDVQRKVFFRRHYPLSTLRFCGMDPEQRKWQKYCKPSWIFGFVAKSQTEPQENVCHLFAEYDTVQPASRVISLVAALLQNPERM